MVRFVGLAAALLLTLAVPALAEAPKPAAPLVGEDVVFEEVGGVVAVEAEHFARQELTETRAWYLTAPGQIPQIEPDADPAHLAGASRGAYLEILPDTRRNHDEPLRHGENFSNEPGKLAVLHYRVWFNKPGTYHVWARIYSTGTEDNGLHVGLDDQWPETGQRMQWTAKNRWAWGSKQRTAEVHTGVPGQLFLVIEKPGLHTISFSMREDGIEFDKWMMTTQRLDAVEGTGPEPRLRQGTLPEPFPAVTTAPATQATQPAAQPRFDEKRDLLSLHYDHAPDQDDGHSAAADRTILETHFGPDWLAEHTVAVSGAYGLNKNRFNPKSDAVMDAVWNDRGGWLAAHDDWDAAVAALVERWGATLNAGGDVWVKEGGQSDITADVVRLIQQRWPAFDTTARIHVVQHSGWNERQTTPEALAYTRQHTDYIRIADANRFLNLPGGHDAFEAAAVAHPVFGPGWRAAFDYYPPNRRLDFSDTGELMHILNLGEIGIEAFANTYLSPRSDR